MNVNAYIQDTGTWIINYKKGETVLGITVKEKDLGVLIRKFQSSVLLQLQRVMKDSD